MPRLFIDTANLDEIQQGVDLGIFSGVTINPVLMRKETEDYRAHADEVFKIVPDHWDISLQVRYASPSEMVMQVRRVASWDERVRIKVPAVAEGFIVMQACPGVKFNATIIKDFGQGFAAWVLSQNAGIDMFLSVFCGRMLDEQLEWEPVVRSLAKLSGIRIPVTQVLAASIKKTTEKNGRATLHKAIDAGADIITAPLNVYMEGFDLGYVWEDVDSFNAAFDIGERGYIL